MINLIDDLLEYIKTGNASPELLSSERLVEPKVLRLISINIVDWLKLESKRKESKPMTLNPEYPWCQSLEKLLLEDTIFSGVFFVQDTKLFYNDNVSEEERIKAQSMAVEKYNPPALRTITRS